MYKWINPIYLDSTTQESIQKQFEDSSEITLDSFLNEEIYNELCSSLKNDTLTWTDKGPSNRR